MMNFKIKENVNVKANIPFVVTLTEDSHLEDGTLSSPVAGLIFEDTCSGLEFDVLEVGKSVDGAHRVKLKTVEDCFIDSKKSQFLAVGRWGMRTNLSGFSEDIDNRNISHGLSFEAIKAVTIKTIIQNLELQSYSEPENDKRVILKIVDNLRKQLLALTREYPHIGKELLDNFKLID